MDKFQEIFEDMQYAILNVFNNMVVLLYSERKTSDEKVELLKQYVKEQSSIISTDIAIHNDKELDKQPEKLYLVQ